MSKHIITLFVIFAAGLVALGFFEQFQIKSTKHSDHPFINVKLDDVHAFEVHQFAEALRFEKNNNTWSVKKILSKLAQSILKKEGKTIGDEDKEFSVLKNLEATKALTYLTELKVGEPISTAETSPDIFQMNPYSLQVQLIGKDNQLLDTVFIGKSAPDPMTSFVRRNNDTEVYLANQDFRLLFLRTKEEWLQPIKNVDHLHDEDEK